MDQISFKKGEKNIENWDKIKIPVEIIESIPLESVKRYRFAPFIEEENVLKIAMVDPEDSNSLNSLKFYLDKQKKKAVIYSVSEEIFEVILNKFKNPELEINKAIESFERETEESERSHLTKKFSSKKNNKDYTTNHGKYQGSRIPITLISNS